MRRRLPTPDELRLWAEVAKSVAPLGEVIVVEEAAPALLGKPAPRTEPAAVPPPPASPRRKASAPPLATIDKRTVSRVSRGVVEIDARIDLHGMTQAAAHGRLVRFLKEAQADGARLILVITGKGRPSLDGDDDRPERGVLRRMVPAWLSAAEMRPFVVGFGDAAPPHGGTGALYVRIRRVRG